MNNFKEKANQFLKENYGIEDYIIKNESFKKSILKFFNFFKERKIFNIDFDKVTDLIVDNLNPTNINVNKVIKVILYCSYLEEELWVDSSSYLGYCDDSKVSDLFEKRKKELDDLWDKDEKSYIKRFGKSWESNTDKKELKYCLQDIKEDPTNILICFKYVVKSCLEYIFSGYSYKTSDDELNELLNIVL